MLLQAASLGDCKIRRLHMTDSNTEIAAMALSMNMYICACWMGLVFPRVGSVFGYSRLLTMAAEVVSG